MQFLLQSENKNIDIDVLLVEDVIKSASCGINYLYSSILDMQNVDKLDEYIPVGSLEFVHKWLNLVYGIKNINPIEIPDVLRTFEFLKRKYKIVKASDVPKKGRYFIKDVSVLKNFSYSGDMENFDFSLLQNDRLYQVSEIVEIEAEYRVYIIQGKIEAIVQYDGNPLSFCDKRYIVDSGLLNKANIIYSMTEDYPNSYTMDIIVNERGTSICEVHPFISVGLYSTLWGVNLLSAYKDGILYAVNKNRELVEFAI